MDRPLSTAATCPRLSGYQTVRILRPAIEYSGTDSCDSQSFMSSTMMTSTISLSSSESLDSSLKRIGSLIATGSVVVTTERKGLALKMITHQSNQPKKRNGRQSGQIYSSASSQRFLPAK